MKKIAILLFISVIFSACSKDDGEDVTSGSNSAKLAEMKLYMDDGKEVGMRLFDLSYDSKERLVSYTIESTLVMRHSIDYREGYIIDTYLDVGEIGIGDGNGNVTTIQVDCLRDTFFLKNNLIVKENSEQYMYDEPDEGYADWHLFYDKTNRLSKAVPNFPDYDEFQSITYNYESNSFDKTETNELYNYWYKYTYLLDRELKHSFEWLPLGYTYIWQDCKPLLLVQGFYGNTLPNKLPSSVCYNDSYGNTRENRYDYVPNENGLVSKIYQDGKLWAELIWK